MKPLKNDFKKKSCPRCYHCSFKGFTIIILSLCLWHTMNAAAGSQSFPAAGWHRGDVTFAQENSYKAIEKAFASASPNVEVDILDFIDREKGRVGLLVHDYDMERIAGSKGEFNKYNLVAELPYNSANPDLSPERYMTVIDLFELIKATKEVKGVLPIVSLDMKEEKTGEEFGKWIGKMIRQYGFQEHVFASSFQKSNIIGIETACSECLTGGLVFNDHFALKYLDHHHTSLDLTGMSKITFFMGFFGKEEYPHDFVLIQDDIFFATPDLITYWKKNRKVKFVGVFVYQKERPYTDAEWEKLKRVDWLELDPPQINGWLKSKQQK